MKWEKYFEEAIISLREEEDKLNARLKRGDNPQNELGIDYELRRIGRITEGLIEFLELLCQKGKVASEDKKMIKYEIGWLQADSIAMKLDNYPLPHPPLE